MYEDIWKALKELEEFDLDALIASINEPPLEVLLKELQDSTEEILRDFRDS